MERVFSNIKESNTPPKTKRDKPEFGLGNFYNNVSH